MSPDASAVPSSNGTADALNALAYSAAVFMLSRDASTSLAGDMP